MIYQIPGHPRSRAVCVAMMQGIARVGDKPRLKSSITYQRPEGHVGLFYGLAGRLGRALVEYPEQGRTAVYADLGYWKRKEGGRWAGYHKLSINGRHPLGYFQTVAHDGSRAEALGLQLHPWTRGENVVVVAMGPKGSRAEGFKAVLDWEKAVIAKLRMHTDRPIIFRPKPNWDGARPLEDVGYSAPSELVDAQFPTAHAIVSHHSNANVEGLLAGVPSFTLGGVAMPLSLSEFEVVDWPLYPSEDERWQWACDIAWTQFSISEMADGVAWRHLKDEGLVP